MATRATMLGWRGEEAVRRWLERRGFVFVERNFRTRYGEIDLIMQDGDTLVFVEVKTRRSRSFGAPEESISEKKLERIEAAAETYCQRHAEIRPFRMDLAVVERLEWRGTWNIRYTRNI
jgi:putative endonuclease